jgi:hypothetical protein
LTGFAVLLLLSQRIRAPQTKESKRLAKPGLDDKRPRRLAGKSRPEVLTPWPRPAALACTLLAVGETVKTGSRERRRMALPDGSALYLNQNTRVRLDRERELSLAAGEIFLEVAPPAPKVGPAPFLVRADRRTVSALESKFAVQTGDRGPGVVVVQGEVKVSGLPEVISAGRQLKPGARKPAAAPRTSYLLAWTRDLMAAAQSPLVPASKYSGGSLVAVDPSGQDAVLSLRKYHIDVHIEDGFARTTIDQTYFNHEAARLEGTFYFPLPADASLSRLAMYVDGNLMEGGMAERGYARRVYETIVRSAQDPALLEWVEGGTFRMRVFPLEPRQEKRIILSYTQRLPALYGTTRYRFSSGHSLNRVRRWSFHARIKNAAGVSWNSSSHPLRSARDGSDLLLDSAGSNVRLERDVVLQWYDPNSVLPENDRARFSFADHEGARYLMVQYRPNLSLQNRNPKIENRRDWVFLFESSGDHSPLAARAQIEVIRSVLANAQRGDTFAILSASTRVRTFTDKLLPCTAANVGKALAFLERTHLVGALDLGKALEKAAALLKTGRNPCLFHVGSAMAGIGERREDVLARRLSTGVPYVGVGVGKPWSRLFMQTAAERTGGYVTQLHADESIAWRMFDLVATLNRPRLLNVKVADPAGTARFLTEDRILAQGEELCAITRLVPDGRTGTPRPLPRSLVISGTLNGKKYRRPLAVKDVVARADYLPRTWAKWEIDRLLAGNAPSQRDKIIALSKAMYVTTPYTSLLVLENEAMYKQYKVDRGRKDYWAVYPAPQKIKVVREVEPNQPSADRNASPSIKPTAEHVLQTILVRVPPALLSPNNPQHDDFGSHPDERNPRRKAHTAGPHSALEIYTSASALSEEDLDPIEAIHKSPPRFVQFFPRPVVQSGGPPDVQEQIADSLEEWKDPQRLREIRQVLEKLARPIILEKGIEANTPLKDVLEFFGQEYEIPIILDTVAFKEENAEVEIEEQHVELPKLNGVSLGTALRRLLAQLPTPGTYVVRRDYLIVTTERRKRIAQRDHPYPIGNFGEILRGSFEWENGFDVFETGETRSATWPPPNGRYSRSGRLRSEVLRQAFPLLPGLIALQKAPDPSVGDLWPPPSSSKGLQNMAAETIRLANPTRFRDADKFVTDLMNPDLEGQSLLYRRPTFSKNSRVFRDLTTHAPAMNTTRSDILAVLEAEARPEAHTVPGRIDPAARQLIDRARAAGWQKVTIPQSEGAAKDFTVTHDGGGRFVYDRLLPTGLREQVVCDGRTLLHFYPELGIGARRRFSRFHQVELARLVPWALPRAEHLARGADLRCAGKRTVVIVPRTDNPVLGHDGKRLVGTEVQLLFAEEGRLTERRLVRVPSGKVLYWERYAADGTVRLLDGDFKELHVQRRAMAAAGKPNLHPPLKHLVVLPLPLRTQDQVFQTRPGVEKTEEEMLEEGDALALLAVHFATGESSAADQLFRHRFRARGDRRLGFYTLLAAAGVPVGRIVPADQFSVLHMQPGIIPAPGPGFPLPALSLLALNHKGHSVSILETHPRTPLARYLGVVDNAGLRVPSATGARLSPWENFLRRLMHLHFLSTSRNEDLSRAGIAAVIREVRKQGRDPFGWAMLSLLHDRVAGDAANRRALADAYKTFADFPPLAYAADYEHARGLLLDKRPGAALRSFLDLYARTRGQGVLPRIDRRFRQALRAGVREKTAADPWTRFVRQTAAGLIKQKHRPAAVALAWQCWQLGEPALARKVLTMALGRMAERERLRTTLAALDFFWRTHQDMEADQLLGRLLGDTNHARRSSLWRLGAVLAAQRRRPVRALECLERAVDLDFRQPPAVLARDKVRSDISLLLSYYMRLADAHLVANQKPARELSARVIQAVDRWRLLDPENLVACSLAAQILYKLGERELAWDYLNTPVAFFPPEAESWLGLAQALHRQEDFALAARAYEQAFTAEPANPQLLLDQAQALEQGGQQQEARRANRRLAAGPWQPKFAWIQREARRKLAGR